MGRRQARRMLIALIDAGFIGTADDKVVAACLERRGDWYSMHVNVKLVDSLPKKCRHW